MLIRVHRVFMCLLGELVSAQMVSLTMGDGGSCVSMGREIVKLRGPIVSGQRHAVLLIAWMQRL